MDNFAAVCFFFSNTLYQLGLQKNKSKAAMCDIGCTGYVYCACLRMCHMHTRALESFLQGAVIR